MLQGTALAHADGGATMQGLGGGYKGFLEMREKVIFLSKCPEAVTPPSCLVFFIYAIRETYIFLLNTRYKCSGVL